ncbi:MAG TPA: hypothetical protein VJ953_21695 [Saprospiraceae bacterium]|nr:hypothetical protein [Saprospiraceae bacterium]
MNNDNIKELARSRAREILATNQTFRNLPVPEQRKMYRDVVQEQMDQLLSEQQGLSSEMRRRRRGRNELEFKDKASDLINDSRHDSILDFSNAGEALEDVMESVNFPKFVADLLKAVFDANIDVMKAQTDDYIRLMKEATTGLAKFIKQIDSTTTFAYLAENNPDEFNIAMEEDDEGNEKLALTKPNGDEVDMDDNEVKAKIMDAKIKMAQEHRAALREIILMGVTRLVVEKGEIEAEVLFDFKGKRQLDKKDKALLKAQKSSGGSVRASGGLLGSIFGGPKGGTTWSNRQTQLSVSSAKSSADDTLRTKLRGFVNIKFKTDYFKLDNFAQMYGPVPQDAQQAAANQPQLPAAK